MNVSASISLGLSSKTLLNVSTASGYFCKVNFNVANVLYPEICDGFSLINCSNAATA